MTKKQKEFMKKLLASIKAKPIPVPSDKEGYFAWLKSKNEIV